MQRILLIAFIGFIYGLAWQTIIALGDAGDWGREQHAFWQTLPSQQDGTSFEAQDLILRGKLLLFQQRLIEGSLENCMTGILSFLVVAMSWKALDSRFPQCRSDLFTWLYRETAKFPSAKSAYVMLALTLFIPFTMLLAGIVYCSFNGYIYSTSIAILVPSCILFLLIVCAANKKQLFPWQGVSENGVVDSSLSSANRTTKYILQLGIYLACPVISSIVLMLCSQSLQWNIVQRNTEHRIEYSLHDAFRTAGEIDMMNMAVTIVVMGITAFFSEKYVFKSQSRNLAGVFFNTFLMLWILMLALPVVQPFVVQHGFSPPVERIISANSLFIFTSLSTLFASLTGLSVALAGNRMQVLNWFQKTCSFCKRLGMRVLKF